MRDLNKMSPAARSAAMRGGMDGWGQVGGPDHIRYMEALERKSRRLRWVAFRMTRECMAWAAPEGCKSGPETMGWNCRGCRHEPRG